MSRRTLSALILGCIAVAAGTIVYTASATVPTTRSFAVLNGAQEFPGPGDANGSGAALVTLKPASNEVCISIRFNKIDGTLSGMHIHKAATGAAGPIVADLTAALSSKGVGCVTVSASVVQEIRSNPKGFYCNVHSTPSFGAGAIRGQLRDSDI